MLECVAAVQRLRSDEWPEKAAAEIVDTVMGERFLDDRPYYLAEAIKALRKHRDGKA